jgi:hypothetical protein
MIEKKYIGGAKYGFVGATWPFAELKVQNDNIMITISGIGKIAFLRSDIEDIKQEKKGISFSHKVIGYNHKIIFYYKKLSPTELVNEIKKTSFWLDSSSSNIEESAEKVRQLQKEGFLTFKPIALLSLFALWNIPILSNTTLFSGEQNLVFPMFKGFVTSAFLVFSILAMILSLKPIRSLFLKDGRTIQDINRFTIFAMIILAFLGVQFYHI